MNRCTPMIPRTTVLLAGALAFTALLAQGNTAPASLPHDAAAGWGAKHWLALLAGLQTVIIISIGGILRNLSGPGPHWARIGKQASGKALMIGLLLAAGHVQAQEAAPAAPAAAPPADFMLWVLGSLNIVLFLVILFQVRMARWLTGLSAAQAEATVVVAAVAAKPSWWTRLKAGMTKEVPVERETEIDLGHEYDGIRELDNSLPPWWLWLFYGTIAWGVMYLVNVHVIKIWPGQEAEYRAEMAQAKADVAAYLATRTDLVDENTVENHADPAAIANGHAIFLANCTPCHGKALEGVEGLGPNLTDEYWKHGGGIKNIFRTIKYGVPEKGMPSWKTQLKPSEIAATAEFILSLQGSHPPNAKAAEGELWKDDAAPAKDTTGLAGTSTPK